MENLTPQRVDSLGRIYSTGEDGRTVVTHTDPEESQVFFTITKALAAGRNELWLLIHAPKTADGAILRAQDGRSDKKLRADWIRKVTNAGLDEASAEGWLDGRLELETEGPIDLDLL